MGTKKRREKLVDIYRRTIKRAELRRALGMTRSEGK